MSGRTYIEISCSLPGGRVCAGKVSARWSVDQVKKWIFTESPSLFALTRDKFMLGVSKAELLLDEERLFVESHPKINVAFLTGESVEIILSRIGSVSLVSSDFDEAASMIHLFTDPIYEGFLTKRGGSVKSWNRRWCILKDNFISYFRNKDDLTPVGAIPLQDAFNCKAVELSGKKHSFCVYTRSRTFYLFAESEEEKIIWIEKIIQVLASLGIALMETNSPVSMEAGSFAHPDREGFLFKTGKGSKGWKRRWFVLQDQFIYYFKTPKATAPLGVIPLQDAKVTEISLLLSRDNCFCINTRHRVFNLSAESAEEAKMWLYCLNNSRDHQISLNSLGTPLIARRQNTVEIPEGFWESREMIDLKQMFYDEAIRNFHQRDPELTFIINAILSDRNDSQIISNDEVEFFRMEMAQMILKEQTMATAAASSALIRAASTKAPLPSSFPSLFPIFFFIPNSDVTNKSIPCSVNDSITDALNLLLKRKKQYPTLRDSSFDPMAVENASPPPALMGSHAGDVSPLKNFLVKVTGRAEYILDASQLLSQLICVREGIKRGQKIQLSLLPKESFGGESQEAPRIGSQRKLRTTNTSTVIKCISAYDLNIPFEIKILDITFDLSTCAIKLDAGAMKFYVELFIAHGGKPIGTIIRTPKRNNLEFRDTLQSSLSIAAIPKEARLCITLYARSASTDVPLAWVNSQIFDYQGKFKAGPSQLMMWRLGKATPLATCDQNHQYDAPILNVEFLSAPAIILKPLLPVSSYALPAVVAAASFSSMLEVPSSSSSSNSNNNNNNSSASNPFSESDLKTIERIITSGPLENMSDPEKNLIWSARDYIMVHRPEGVAKLMLSVNWSDPIKVSLAHSMLNQWRKINPIFALELLDYNFADTRVREFAVNCIDTLTNQELQQYLLQLVQVLKYEAYHFNPLSCFLIRRAISDPQVLGHYFFWHLYSEWHINKQMERFRLLLEAFLYACGAQVQMLYQGVNLVHKLRNIAVTVKLTKTARRTEVLLSELEKLQLPRGLPLPLNPRMQVRGLLLKQCKWLDSFTVPLWLVFENEDPKGDPIFVIFKSGDDLRQDVLTLQMIRLIDEICKAEALDLHLTPYDCCSTGDEMGMIEVVLNSETTANIQKNAGGATAVFNHRVLLEWLQDNNKGEKLLDSAVDNFRISLAGYCVATFVLGIGDRHNDNIMVTKRGHLFHIDFAHFLGNVMTFHGIKRERAPFVLTPDFVHVMKANKCFAEFCDLCARAFNIARKHSRIFITLFTMMLSTGIPQLNKAEDLQYLTESFCLGKSDDEATLIFKNLITESLNTKTTQINFAIHILAHPD